MSFVWGIDVAISRLAFAFADLASDDVDVETLVTACDATEGERLGLIDRQVRVYARQIAGRFPPHVVWVEQPSGRFQNPQLYYTTGALQAALFETLKCPVWTVPSSKWKALSVGRGNATKEQIAAWVTGRRFVFAGQDQADAIGIAWAGRQLVQARKWNISTDDRRTAA